MYNNKCRKEVNKMLMIRRNLNIREIWAYYWKEKNKKENKKTVDKQIKKYYN